MGYFADELPLLIRSVSWKSGSRLKRIQLQQWITAFLNDETMSPETRLHYTEQMACHWNVPGLRSAWMSVAMGAVGPTQIRSQMDFIRALDERSIWKFNGLLQILEAAHRRATQDGRLLAFDVLMRDIAWYQRTAFSYAREY